ncbi:hypothetical protein [Saccharopolyspora sp. CA-218241]|uniref:baeRF11 domain-containing protein n=1 Tax=Saccharopolyspora sp. CA-218241 TaxID=3240027 RepID=UPI003D9795F7
MAILHTDIPTRRQISALLAARDRASASLYLVTDPTAIDNSNQLELRGRGREALDQLRAGGVDKHDVAAVEEHLVALIEDTEFWRFQARSLAVFATPGSIRTFRLPNRLQPGVEVADRFHVKPLLRAVTFPQTALLLALAQNSVRVLQIVSDMDPKHVEVRDLPKNIDTILGHYYTDDRSPIRRLQGDEGRKLRLTQYAREVDRALRPLVTGSGMPLILAATEPLQSTFRSICGAAELAPVGLTGNPEESTDRELASHARAVLDDVHADELRAVHERFDARVSQALTATDVAEVARLATLGAVDTAFVDIDSVEPGHVDDAGGVTFTGSDPSPAESAADYGVVDEIARRVWLTDGRVLAVRRPDIPGEGPVAAILRYRPPA